MCCGVGTVADVELERVAFESLDDAVALVDLRPVTVESLWRSVLESLKCGDADSVTVIYPSWWTPRRVGVIRTAAEVLGDKAVMKPRSWLLDQASTSAVATVEIADGFVVVSGSTVVAETRRREQRAVVEAVVSAVLRMATIDTIVIDAPRTVCGAGTLSALIAEELRAAGGMTVLEIGDMELRKLAAGIVPSDASDDDGASEGAGRRRWQLALMVPIVSAVLGVGVAVHRPTPPTVQDVVPTTVVVEGHVALEVPSGWPVRRVVAGPGSARLQISSPSDPEVALHVTQSKVALAGLDATAEFLKSAIDSAPAGVFVDFNPAGQNAGRPVVTYREVRSGHDVRWTVWVDKAIRISIGCQSRHGLGAATSSECDRAVRSARAVM
ncbi:type VII secretion-associated protein [Mycobacterium cookii]|uniref:Type VII secretion-associated protein n=1 Tax=Mycobacterium cookii TaxID=1775 RepID=A0A7I7L3W8_9MYCO|nr:type VII secretion-associated protein [Mycobacterium cookii]